MQYSDLISWISNVFGIDRACIAPLLLHFAGTCNSIFNIVILVVYILCDINSIYLQNIYIYCRRFLTYFFSREYRLKSCRALHYWFYHWRSIFIFRWHLLVWFYTEIIRNYYTRLSCFNCQNPTQWVSVPNCSSLAGLEVFEKFVLGGVVVGNTWLLCLTPTHLRSCVGFWQ